MTRPTANPAYFSLRQPWPALWGPPVSRLGRFRACHRRPSREVFAIVSCRSTKRPTAKIRLRRWKKKARLLAFLIARNRPRRLSRNIRTQQQTGEQRVPNKLLSVPASERWVRSRALPAPQRLGGEEVRFIDIPGSDPNSAGIFDGNIKPAPGKTLRETTKDLVDALKANAIKHQGHALRELLEKYVNDERGLEHLRTYKEQFERDVVLSDRHNAHYRVRTNFAVFYAAAALAIDYEILPWKKSQHSGPSRSACILLWQPWKPE